MRNPSSKLKYWSSAGLIVAASVLAWCTVSAAPALINTQGRLTLKNAPTPADSTYQVVFTIYDDSLNGTILWSETYPSLRALNGQFSVLLGSNVALGSSLFDADNRWLGMKVGSDAEMRPRSRLVSVPFAQRVASIEGAAGGNVDGNISLVGRIKDSVSSGVVIVNGYSPSSVPSIYFKNNAAPNNWVMYHDDNNRLLLVSRSGNSVFQIAGQSAYTVDFQVDGKTTTKILTITGGSDLAEPFEYSETHQVEPGSVLVIDNQNPGKLCLSSTPYDTRVAGVASGAGGVKPGLTLRQDGILDEGQHVALAGRVFVKATCQNGGIQPGDRLTTSALPGLCMKATDAARCDGAIIGKAMSALESGDGLVLVLVNLE